MAVAPSARVPFTIHVSDSELADLGERLRHTRFSASVATAPWAAGVDETVLRPLVDHWRDRFDWRDRERAFDVVPSLPGYAFSDPFATPPFTARRVADLWRSLMVDTLGYERFLTYGEDVGTGVSDTLAGGEWADERGHSEQQRTKPDTLAASLVDSPAGLAAWLVEKYRTCSGGAAWRTRVPPVVRRADLP